VMTPVDCPQGGGSSRGGRSPQKQRIRGVLARDPTRRWTIEQVAAETGMAPQTVRRYLLNLVAEGVVQRDESGRAHLFSWAADAR
jgi:DNA-binding IclR family transcriptional regulator